MTTPWRPQSQKDEEREDDEIGQLNHKKSNRVRQLRNHEMTPWDRPGSIQNPRTDWDPSPAQRGERLPELPPVPDDIDWPEYTAYKCRHCKDDCINLRETIPAVTDQCWSCLRLSSLDDDDGSYLDALVDLKVAYRLHELGVSPTEELPAPESV